MISLIEAWQIIEKKIKRLPAEEVQLQDLAGCVLAENIDSPIDVPGFASSAMDGIAINSADLEGERPWKLTLEGVILAGDDPLRRLSLGHCVKVMTGAPLPNGADTVIKLDELEFESGRAVIDHEPPRGQNIRAIGDDIKKGEKLFNKGMALKPADIGVIASVGLTSAKAIPIPSIAFLSTGAEIIQPGKPLNPGQVYSSSQYAISPLLNRDGYNQVDILSHIKDDPEALAELLKSALNDHHVVITAGGVSGGEFEYIPQVVNDLGGKVILQNVSVIPEMPILIAKVGKSWFIGLPGNPLSLMVGYLVFVRRILVQLRGSEYHPKVLEAKLDSKIESAEKKLHIVGVQIEKRKRSYLAKPVDEQSSAKVSSIKGIDGVIYMGDKLSKLAKGDKVKVELF